MGRARKILKYILAAGSSLIIILALLSVILEGKISRVFISQLNKNLSVPVSTTDLNFSLLKRFPRASLELKELLVKSPVSGDEKTASAHPDTLLYAGKMTLTLKLAPLVRKNYVVDRIDIDRGVINISRGPSGRMNTDIYNKPSRPDSVKMNLNINNVNISNSSLTYSDRETGFCIGGIISHSSNKVLMEEGLTGLKSKSNILLSILDSGKDYRIDKPYPVKFNAGLAFSGDSIKIDPAEINIDGTELRGDCHIVKAGKELSISLESGRADIKKLALILLPGSSDFIENYSIDGVLTSTLAIKGSYEKNSPLILLADLVLGKGMVKLSSPGITVGNISTTARLSMDLRKHGRPFEISAASFDASLDNTAFSGSFYLRNLKNPYIDLVIRGAFPSEKLAAMLNTKDLASSRGSLRINARLSGTVPSRTEESKFNIMELDRSVNLGLNSVNLSLPGLKDELNNINGNIMIAGNIWIDDLSMSYNDQKLALNGMVKGFDGWLQGKDPNMEITAGIWSDKLDPGSLIGEFTGGTKREGRRETRTKLNLNILCDSIIIGKVRASLFDGNLAYVPGLIDISSFSMNTLEGSLSGNAVIADLGENAYAMRGWFDIENVDIQETFATFNNFRQDYLVSENIEGLLTGSISLSATADRQFKIKPADLVLNGEYQILNGKLINFEPAYKLSRFIEIDELAEIQFSRLENELIINNEIITIPKMDISSSAFNISLEGNHGFDGNYEYHIKVLLSEFLSKKNNERVSEFGVVEDDRLGRTSVYLTLSGNKDGSRLSHDTEALRTGIKEDLQKEKQNIKSILSEEYGWYRGDTARLDETDKTRRFRVVWEEADSIKTGAADTTEKKLPLLKLFKKKK